VLFSEGEVHGIVPMKHLPRRLAYIAAGLSFLTLAVIALRPAPIPVDIGQVERGDLQITVDEEGKTRVPSRYIVSAPVAGRLARIELDAGDLVKQADIIARIDPLPLDTQVREAQARLRELQAQRTGVEAQRPKQAALDQAQARIRLARATLRQAEARVEQAQAALAQARRDRQRAQALEASGAISRQDREAAELDETTRARGLEAVQREADAATAEVTAAQEALTILQAERRDPDYLLRVYDAQIASVEAELANLADEAARTEISAPVSGHVLRVLQESARYVEAGTQLLELGDASTLELVIDVLSTDAVKVQPGAPILIEQWGGDEALQAKVRYVEPAAFTEVSALGVEEQRVNVIADFVNAPMTLGDGYRVEAQIVVWEGQDVLKVPVSALSRCDEESWCVFVVDDGKAEQRQVAIGHRSTIAAEVQQGLTEGESVILYPTEQIDEGKRIVLRS
jgi:HlyD family secretion protein